MENETRKDLEKVVIEYCSKNDCTNCKLKEICQEQQKKIHDNFSCNSPNSQTAPYFKRAYDIITNSDNAPVNHPSHYCDGSIETIDFIKAKLTKDEFTGFCKGNALKYISRAGKKDNSKEIEDLSKAMFYLDKVIKYD